jgi:Family of unknown function (DUF5681)
MNPNLAEVGKPTRWPRGQSGNPAGKPPGTRTAFSQGFIRDFALVWAEEGLEAVRKVAKKSPDAFVAIAARICPNDVRLTLEQAIPGEMSLEDYSLMREVIAAIREGLPEADQMQPGAVFQHVLGALHHCSKKDWSLNSCLSGHCATPSRRNLGSLFVCSKTLISSHIFVEASAHLLTVTPTPTGSSISIWPAPSLSSRTAPLTEQS